MESHNKQKKCNQINILQQLSQKNKFDYLDNNNDCLTDAFITIYESSLWCMKLFFKSLLQVLLFTKEELYYSQNEIINSIDVLSMNNSAGKNYSKKMYRDLPCHHLSMIQRNNQRRYRYRLPKSNCHHLRQKTISKINMLSSKTRVTIRSISNQNLNRAESNHTSVTKEQNPSNTIGTINSHITVVPINSSHCQNVTSTNDLKQSGNINLREQLADTLCRRSYKPLTFINRGICCGHCRPLFFPNAPFHHSDHYVPSTTPQQELNQERELSKKSEQSLQMGDASETQSTPYSGGRSFDFDRNHQLLASPNIESHLTDSPKNEPLSTNTITNDGTKEQNHSILSFPEHDTSPSQVSEELIDDDDSQLKLNAQILVDDSIQTAQEKYQEILRMSTDQDLKDKTSAAVKQITKNQSKSALIFNKSNIGKLSDDNTLCQQLCNKLNLSDSNQIAEIVRILASNAPHILKEQSLNKTSLINNSNTNKDNENTLYSQLLLNTPLKPKRLIHLCPDESNHVLSTIGLNLNENQIITQQQYRFNYCNSATTPVIQQNHILTNESSLALIDKETNFNHIMLTESTATQQLHSKDEILFDHLIRDNNSIISFQQKKTLFKYNSPLMLTKDNQLNSDHSKTISQDDDPIVKINLDLSDETIEENNEDDENSLPEIFFKRIIVPESSTILLTDDNNVRCKNHQTFRHNRSRSRYTNKKTINLER